MRKYAVFSRVKVKEEDELVLLGVAGFQAREALESLFFLPNASTPVIKDEDTTLLWFNYPTERFFLATTPEKLYKIQENLKYSARFSDSQQWLSLEIESGIPIIEPTTSARFIPQATGLQLLDAISFEKGCYIGQEVVTKSTLRGMNKRALYWLTGYTRTLPKVGSSVERLMKDRWRSTGMILASVKVNEDETWLQVVMNINLGSEIVFRIPGEINSSLKIRERL
jgi:folate-binding protein YgfZ